MPSLSARHGLYLLGCFTVALCGQTPPSETNAPNPNETNAPRQSAPPQRATEPNAALAGITFETPEAEKKKEPEPLPDDVDLREIDRPRNAIIRLPKYLVEGERPPVFAEKEINTKKGLAELAVKRYLSNVHQGLNRYHLPAILGGLSNEALAMEMYHDNERLEAIKEYDEKLSLFRAAGDKEATVLKKESDATFRRRGEFNSASDRRKSD